MKRLIALFPYGDGSGDRLLMVAADAASARLSATAFDLAGAPGWPSITPVWPEAHLFEREIHERWGLVPEGHPWLKAVRGHRELEATPVSPAHPFLRAEGEGIHEVAVGPIHAGIIEPGHFRFQCFGEEVLHLEIHLGHHHRGAEQIPYQASQARRLPGAYSTRSSWRSTRDRCSPGSRAPGRSAGRPLSSSASSVRRRAPAASPATCAPTIPAASSSSRTFRSPSPKTET